MKRLLCAIVLLLVWGTSALAREKYQNWCQQGGQTVTVSGIVSTTTVQRSFKTCTVTVYLGGTTTLASIYSDDSGTPLANPFTNQNTNTGQFFFYADNGTYDVKFAATGLTTYTNGAISLLDPSVATGLVRDCSTPKYAAATADLRIKLCLADLPVVGGIADARGIQGAQTIASTVTIGAYQILLLGPGTYTCTIVTASNPCWNLTGNTAKLIGLGSGNAGSGTDPSSNAASGITNLLCSCGTTTDMIRVAIPSASRTSLNAAILFAPQVSGLWINMGGSGRRAVYVTSTHYADYFDIQGFNFVENGFEVEGDLASPNNSAEVYQNHFARIQMQPPASNTTGIAFHLNATNGEISWNTIENLRASGNISTGGGLKAVVLEAGASAAYSLGHNTIRNSYIANTSCQAGRYGLQFKAGGTYSSQSGGRIFDFTLYDTLIETLFACGSGVGAGGTDASDSPSGNGIGSISFINSGVTANWATGFDRANLGQSYTEISGFTNPGAGQPSFRISGTTFGANSVGIYNDSTMVAGSNSDSLFGANSSLSVNANGKTGVSVYGHNVGWGSYTSGGGTVTNAYSYYTSAPTFGTNNWAFYAGTGKSLMQQLGVGVDVSNQTQFRVGGNLSAGNNTTGVYTDIGLGAQANSDALFGVKSFPGWLTGGKTSLAGVGIAVDMGGSVTGGGTFASGIGVDTIAPNTSTFTLAAGGFAVAARAQGGVMVTPGPNAQPTCAAAYRGTIWVTNGGAGVKDAAQICMKDATDTYAWRTIY